MRVDEAALGVWWSLEARRSTGLVCWREWPLRLWAPASGVAMRCWTYTEQCLIIVATQHFCLLLHGCRTRRMHPQDQD